MKSGKPTKKKDSASTPLIGAEETQQPASFFNRGTRPKDDEAKSGQIAFASKSVNASDRFKGSDLPFVDAYGYNWDFVLVFPFGSQPTGKLPSRRPDEIVQKIQTAGLETYLFSSVQKDEIICKIRAPVSRLESHADQIDFKMLLDENRLKETAEWGIPESKVGPIRILHDPAICELTPYRYIYARYDTDDRLKNLYERAHGLTHPFGPITRIKLIVDILKTSESQHGAGLSLARLKQDGSILAYFPLHSIAERDYLQSDWIVTWQWPWDQPYSDIRGYFGEKVALYFSFLGHYATWLLLLGVMGFGVTLDVLGEYTTQAYSVPFFAIFVSFWSVLMLEYWKRKEARVRLEWGMNGFEEEEHDRAEFTGKKIQSYIDGKDMTYYPPDEQRTMVAQSLLVIFNMVVLVVAAVAAVFTVKILMQDSSNNSISSMSGYTSSFLNAIQIQVLNAVYSDIAVWLTNRENHRTDTAYEDSLIAKLFAFQFVNSYASFFYIAFLKSSFEECMYDSCLTELCQALGIIFVTNLVTGNLSELLVPKIKGLLRARENVEGIESSAHPSRPELEYIMEEYDAVMGTLSDYAELAIQFGYVTLFVTAFPIAPMLAFLNNYIEVRTDGWKLLKEMRRPIPCGAEDIGTWQAIFTIVAYLAVIVNAAIVCFTMTILGDNIETKFIVFSASQYVIFFFMGMFSYLVDDVPDEVTIQLKRQDFLVQKIVDVVADEDDHGVGEISIAPMNLHDTDDEPHPGSNQ